MRFDPKIHHRHSVRLKGYDYSQAGAYFVTIVAWQRECLFGDVVDGEMKMNEFGEIVRDEWEKSTEIRRELELGAYMVMPNHFHAIVIINDIVVPNVGATGRSPLRPNGPKPKSVGALMAGFKSAITKRINVLRNAPGIPVWQRNYLAPRSLRGMNTSSATNAKWTTSGNTSNPIRRCGMMTRKIQSNGRGDWPA